MWSMELHFFFRFLRNLYAVDLHVQFSERIGRIAVEPQRQRLNTMVGPVLRSQRSCDLRESCPDVVVLHWCRLTPIMHGIGLYR